MKGVLLMSQMVPIILITFVIFLVINVPIAVSLGFSALISIIAVGKLPPTLVPQLIYAASDSYSLIAIPFFMLAGSLMETGGLSKRLIDFADEIVGAVPGGLGVIAIITSMFFAAISGSGPATVAALGGILIPAMEEANYDKRYAAALMATAGAIGIIIPPSIPMIVYAVQAEVSVGNMFMGGFAPGFIFGGVLIILNYIISKKHGYKGVQKERNLKTILKAFKSAFFALLMPVIILGGIYGGVFTPTEAAGVSVVYGFVVGAFFYRELKFKDIPQMLSLIHICFVCNIHCLVNRLAFYKLCYHTAGCNSGAAAKCFKLGVPVSYTHLDVYKRQVDRRHKGYFQILTGNQTA